MKVKTPPKSADTWLTLAVFSVYSQTGMDDLLVTSSMIFSTSGV
jgi:hypothetical protein